MFDVGFWEMMLIGLVALVVFGPDKLPRLVREVTLWVRKAKSAVASAKSEIDQELNLYEMRQSFEKKRQHFEREAKTLSKASSDDAPQIGMTAKQPKTRIAEDNGQGAVHEKD